MITVCVSGHVNQSGVAITGAGNLVSVRNVVHLDSSRCYDPAAWKSIIKATLKEAEMKRLESIAFPALGTGQY